MADITSYMTQKDITYIISYRTQEDIKEITNITSYRTQEDITDIIS